MTSTAMLSNTQATEMLSLGYSYITTKVSFKGESDLTHLSNRRDCLPKNVQAVISCNAPVSLLRPAPGVKLYGTFLKDRHKGTASLVLAMTSSDLNPCASSTVIRPVTMAIPRTPVLYLHSLNPIGYTHKLHP